jgi:hypothetical protein
MLIVPASATHISHGHERRCRTYTGLCPNAHQLVPTATAVKAAAANEQHNQNDDDEGGGVHDRSSALRSAFECEGRA